MDFQGIDGLVPLFFIDFLGNVGNSLLIILFGFLGSMWLDAVTKTSLKSQVSRTVLVIFGVFGCKFLFLVDPFSNSTFVRDNLHIIGSYFEQQHCFIILSHHLHDRHCFCYGVIFGNEHNFVAN